MAQPPRFSREDYCDYLNDLFRRALQKAPFEVICAVLRVGGLEDAGWDPFEESKGAFDDFNWYLKAKSDELSEKASWRIALLMYCQAIEMTAPHELIANLLRCLQGQKYDVKPFGHLGRSKKTDPFSWIPPSAKVKFRTLKEWANEAGETRLSALIDSFFRDDIRNAFSHSDYIITEDRFRWTEGGLPAQTELEALNVTILNAFAFYGGFFGLHSLWLAQLGELPRYHKWPQYEVLELLSNSEHGLYGFAVHFSNGSKARYSRTAEGTDCTNITFEKDGSINFFLGPFDALEATWKVDGKPFEQVDGKPFEQVDGKPFEQEV